MTEASLPPKMLGTLSDGERRAILAAIAEESSIGDEWLEKLRRFASLAGRNLRVVARKRFGVEAEAHLRWMAEVLLEGSQRPFGSAPVDQAYLNAALYCYDALGQAFPEDANTATEILIDWLCKTDPKPPLAEPIGPIFTGKVAHWLGETPAKGIVLICPSPFSLYSISVFSILRKLGAPIEAVLLRKFSFSRFRQEMRRDGLQRLVRKIWRKMILRADENADKTEASLKSVYNRLNVGMGDIRALARASGIPIIEVNDFEEAVTPLKDLSPRLAIFTGGGLIRKPLLDAFPDGIINTHMGSLPQHKGMDVVQAPILEGNFDHIALTAHFMEPRLDRGPILCTFQLSSSGYATLGTLRNELSAISPLIAVDAALGYLSGRLEALTQPNCGRQYYFSHPELVSAIRRVLVARHVKPDKKLIAEVVETVFETLEP